ncbi:hypothetical protein [Jannaschia sp. CCS1]|uniref:hypothetical protein n=1 Tax=Jannaschia sp. (strain CCS1) TaxID=290400 RepID=UPI0003142216|nr:hypothetical protein [Jannaschia sp. CCS1]
MDNLLQTRRIARPLSYLTTAALFAYPVTLAVLALSGYFDAAYLRDAYASTTLPDVIPKGTWVAVYAIALVSVALVCVLLWNIRALLVLFAIGDVLGAEVAHRIRRIGGLLLALAIYGVVSNTLTILALTAANPPGARSLAIGVSNTDLFLFLAAGLMTVIGLAMSEAARIAAENRGFI